MTNVQQPEMRRNELNPTVQDSKELRPGDRTARRDGGGRPVPKDQVSPYGAGDRQVDRRR